MWVTQLVYRLSVRPFVVNIYIYIPTKSEALVHIHFGIVRRNSPLAEETAELLERNIIPKYTRRFPGSNVETVSGCPIGATAT